MGLDAALKKNGELGEYLIGLGNGLSLVVVGRLVDERDDKLELVETLDLKNLGPLAVRSLDLARLEELAKLGRLLAGGLLDGLVVEAVAIDAEDPLLAAPGLVDLDERVLLVHDGGKLGELKLERRWRGEC